LTLEIPPGRIERLDLGVRRVAHRVPAAEAPRRRRNATSRLRSLVDCDRTVRISSSSPARAAGANGRP
jgi:hypothetical protein